jgi:hypothetical protein
VSWKLGVSLKSQHGAIMKINQSNDWMPKSCMWMLQSKDGNLRKLAHDSIIVVFSLIGLTQRYLS